VKKLLFGALFALTIGLTVHFFARASGASAVAVLARIGTIGPLLWGALGALTVAFYLLDWLRFRSMLAVLGQPLRYVDGLRLTCVSYFVTSLTPSAELHTPAMVFMLSRQGVPLPQALAASVSKSVYMTLWICLAAWLSLMFGEPVALPPGLRAGLPWLALLLLAMALLLAAIAFFPAPVVRWCDAHALALRDGSLWRKILSGTAATASSISTIGTSTDIAHVLCHVASIAFLLVYVAIGWLLASHFGFQLDWLQALTIFSTSLMIAYLAPVPGAIGVTEVATSYMLSPALTPEGMAVAITLRVLCWYLVALPGALVLAAEFRRAGGRWTLPKVFN